MHHVQRRVAAAAAPAVAASVGEGDERGCVDKGAARRGGKGAGEDVFREKSKATHARAAAAGVVVRVAATS